MSRSVAWRAARWGVTLGAVVLVVPSAWAQPSRTSKPDGTRQTLEQPNKVDAAAAQRKYQAATKRYDKKDYLGALLLYRDALVVSGSPNARLFVARCLIELGRHAEAYNELVRTGDDAEELAKTEPRYARTRDEARKELASVSPKVALVSIALTGAPAQAVLVTVNGEVVDNGRFARPIAVRPGSITIAATADGYVRFHREITATVGATAAVSVVLVKDSPDSAPSPARPSAATARAPRAGGSIRTMGFVVAGVGVASTAAFVVVGSMARSRFDQIEEECGGERCTAPRYADEIDGGRTMTTLANVALVVGVAGVLGGGTMIALGGPKEAPATGAAPGRYISFAPTWGGVAASGRF